MKHLIVILFGCALVSASRAAELPVATLGGNGVLTWTNSVTNATFRVEWASSPLGPWQQFSVLTNLDFIKSSNTTVRVSVPMFYRVVWTDAPAPQPAGDWLFNSYSFAGSLVLTGMVAITNTGVSEVAGVWTFGPGGPLDCSSGDLSGQWGDSGLFVTLCGCSFAECVYALSGTLVGDTYSGTWYEEGFVSNPIGTFVARRKFP
jgi:hypothetical protein